VDYAQVVLGYAQRRVTLHASRLNAWTAARFEAHGTDGSFVSFGLDSQETQLKAGMAPGASGWGEDARPTLLQRGGAPAAEEHARLRGDYRLYYLGVRDAILYGAANPVPAEEALRVMAVLDCALRSAAEGRTLRFEPS
jgi:predicted dehydrogenase